MLLTTQRLSIRSLHRGDEWFFAGMAKDGSLARDIGFDENCAEWIGDWMSEALRFSERDDPRQDYIANAVCLHNGTVIGSVGCSWYEDLRETGITYFIGNAYRGNGYVAEAIRAYVPWALTRYELPRMIATVRDENAPSWKNVERCGFVLP